MSTIRVRAHVEGDAVLVQCLIDHPMASGFVKDASGKIIPAHYIETVTFTSSGKPVFTAFWGPAISKDPFLSFLFKGGKSGDPITVAWTDNKGQSDSTTATIS